jgi:hypothetical protein
LLLGGAMALLVVALSVWSNIADRRRTEAATAALPDARAWLASIPEYRHLEVEVWETGDTGPGILFTGLLPTGEDVMRFDAAAEARFGTGRFAVVSLVMTGLNEKRAAETRRSR